jgi:hypothetical protein
MCRRGPALLFLAATLLGASAHAKPNRPTSGDHFTDSTGEDVSFRAVYDGWFGPNRYRRNLGRALLMNGVTMGFEEFIYWNDPNGNSVDWQYPNLVTKLSRRSAARFDDNLERTNWLLHPIAGATHYGLTRVNGYGVLPSFGAAAVASALYETLFEFREIISINDLIVTPVAGMAMGEFLFQLGNYLDSEQVRPRTLAEVTGPRQLRRELGTVTFGLPRTVTNALDDPAPPPLVPDDALGLSSAYTHRFELFMGEDWAHNDLGASGALTTLGVTAELAAMPGFLRPGNFHVAFSNGNFTRFSARFAMDSSLRELEVVADSHLVGYYSQDIRAAAGGRTGVANEIAGHTMLHYVDRWLFDTRDQYALVHLFGPVDELWVARGHTMLHFRAEVSPDFAAPYSLAYEPFRSVYGDDGTKSSLKSHGYYFAWGVSAAARATMSIDAFSLGFTASYGRYESIDGQERMQEQVSRDPHLHDEVLELSARTTFEPPDIPVALRIETAHVGRRSHMAPFTVTRTDDRIGASFGLRF